ncbi:MAG: hypothetical protein ABI970_03200 [Chloroflexota bacterium]
MTLIQLTGKINDQGQLELDLPQGLPSGTVQVTLEIPSVTVDIPWEERPWTDEELEALLKTDPKTGAEIAAEIEAGLLGNGWSHIKVSGAEWVEEQRRKQRERSQW